MMPWSKGGQCSFQFLYFPGRVRTVPQHSSQRAHDLRTYVAFGYFGTSWYKTHINSRQVVELDSTCYIVLSVTRRKGVRIPPHPLSRYSASACLARQQFSWATGIGVIVEISPKNVACGNAALCAGALAELSSDKFGIAPKHREGPNMVH
jgi:hypothetical protein